MRRLYLLVWPLLVVLASCQGQQTLTGTETACEQAFAVAAAVDDSRDSVSDFYPAVRACVSLEEWTAAFDAHDGAGFAGSATSVLSNMCTAPEIANEALCQEVVP